MTFANFRVQGNANLEYHAVTCGVCPDCIRPLRERDGLPGGICAFCTVWWQLFTTDDGTPGYQYDGNGCTEWYYVR